MPNLIENTWEIRKALGPNMEIIRQLSDSENERRTTERIRKQLLRKYPRACAACQTSFKEDKAVEAAHIFSLEEGGTTTEDNLVLLCHQCHQLYDSGRASVLEARQAADAWRSGSPIFLRGEMDSREPGSVSQMFRPSRVESLVNIYDLLQQRQPLKAIRSIRRARRSSLSGPDAATSHILEAQIERRRSARGSLDKARRTLLSLSRDNLLKEQLPLYYYEAGYIAQMLGRHRESLHFFQKSAGAATDLSDRYSSFEETIARLRSLAVQTIVRPHRPDPAAAVRVQFHDFDTLVLRASEYSQPHAGRWMHNILGWKWRYAHKCAGSSKSREVFSEYSALRDRQNVLTGYTRDFGSRGAGLKGMSLFDRDLTREQMLEVVRLVSRSLVALLSYRIRPESIRDFFITLESALQALKKYNAIDCDRAAREIAEVRSAILDGSSFLDPYRDPTESDM